MTDKLTVYNGALSALTETSLTSLTENRANRWVLDAFYNQAVRFCLEAGQWNFATRTLKFQASTSIEPSFGHRYFFEKPADYVKLCGIWQDEYLNNPLGTFYQEDNQGWYSDINEIYVTYVSDDENFGFDLGNWTSSFTYYVQRYLAFLVVGSVTGSKADKNALMGEVRKAEREAKNTDSWSKPARRLPMGTWARARHSGTRYHRYKS